MPQQLATPLSYKRIDAVKRIGLLVLTTDHTTEIEFSQFIAPRGAEVFTARVEFANPTTPENLRAMLPHIKTAAASVLPGTPLDLIYYACTSGAVHIGNDAITEAICTATPDARPDAKPDAKVITPTSAAVDAFKTLKLKRLALLTPYSSQTSAPLEPYFEDGTGIEIVNHCCLGLEDDREMARLDADTLIRAAIDADHDKADGMFISCTALRVVEIAGEIEKKIGKPVVTSNQAAIWYCLKNLKMECSGLSENKLFTTLG